MLLTVEILDGKLCNGNHQMITAEWQCTEIQWPDSLRAATVRYNCSLKTAKSAVNDLMLETLETLESF